MRRSVILLCFALLAPAIGGGIPTQTLAANGRAEAIRVQLTDLPPGYERTFALLWLKKHLAKMRVTRYHQTFGYWVQFKTRQVPRTGIYEVDNEVWGHQDAASADAYWKYDRSATRAYWMQQYHASRFDWLSLPQVGDESYSDQAFVQVNGRTVLAEELEFKRGTYVQDLEVSGYVGTYNPVDQRNLLIALAQLVDQRTQRYG